MVGLIDDYSKIVYYNTLRKNFGMAQILEASESVGELFDISKGLWIPRILVDTLLNYCRWSVYLFD